MIALPAASALVALCAPSGPIRLLADVAIDHGVVTLGDVADLAALPPDLRGRAAAVEIAHLPAGRGAGRLSAATIVRRAVGALPLLRCATGRSAYEATGVEITFAVPAAPTRSRDKSAEAIRARDHLDLVTASGPVRIARRVEALQPARSGDRLFVRSEDGKVLSVRYAETAR